MINLDKLHVVGKQIETRLVEIRESIGAPVSEFDIKPPIIDIPGEKLAEEAQTKPDKPIIINDEYHIAYIKDNIQRGKYGKWSKADHDFVVQNPPVGCFEKGKKLHFYYCKTLDSMTAQGRAKRYCAMRKFQNMQLIDLADAENVETKLAWCQFCIGVLFTNGNIPSWKGKEPIAHYGDAESLMKCVIMHDKGENGAMERISEFVDETLERSKT